MTTEDRLNVLKKVFNIQKFKWNAPTKDYLFELNNENVIFNFGVFNSNNIYMFSASSVNELTYYLEKSNEIIVRVHANNTISIKFIEDFKNIDI